jgi:hypothetical protein
MKLTIPLLAAGLVVGAGVFLSEAQSNCTTTYNALLKQSETRCSDGSSARETYNPLLRQRDTIITPAPQPSSPFPQQQRCRTTYNALLRQSQTVCD